MTHSSRSYAESLPENCKSFISLVIVLYQPVEEHPALISCCGIKKIHFKRVIGNDLAGCNIALDLN